MDLPLQDIREPIEKMLTACGYNVTRVDADFEFFKNMSSYGVIFIEAHGGIRPSAGLPEAREPGTNAGLSTCVPITLDTLIDVITKYFDDHYHYGRIRKSTVEVRRKGKPTLRLPYWAITPAFIRHYNLDAFPDYSLLCLPAHGRSARCLSIRAAPAT